MIRFKRFITEGQLEKGKLSVSQIIKKIKGRTIIVFDTETTGLDPKMDFNIVTEVAAIAYDIDSGRELGKYHRKAKLTPEVHKRIEHDKRQAEKMKNPKEWDSDTPYYKDDIVSHNGKLWRSVGNQKGSEPSNKNTMWKFQDPKKKTLEDLLVMTAYEEENTEFSDIQDLLIDFKKFVQKYKDPIMVAHNARFDMYQINAGLQKLGKNMTIHNVDVVDTLSISKNYLAPLLQKMADSGDKKAIEAVEVMKDGGKKMRNNLNLLGQIFQVKTKMWHSGLADTMQLAGIFFEIIEFFKTRKIK